ncbi:MAG TPA: hypothetical protein VMR90_01720 [Candidatus Cybelea sp.]|nr:hypothetical protein [Candidatus Cybelea sp.]
MAFVVGSERSNQDLGLIKVTRRFCKLLVTTMRYPLIEFSLFGNIRGIRGGRKFIAKQL